MSLGTDLSAALPALRAAAESMMLSECSISRTSPGGFNEETGDYDSAVSQTIYTGKCRVRFPDGQPNDVDAASQLLVEQRPVLSLPVAGSEAVRIGDVITISANTFDDGMVGAKLRVAGIHTQTFATARRFPCEVISDADV